MADSDESDRIGAIGQRLLGLPITGVARLPGGRNSRVHRIDTAAGPFVLKAYSLDRADRLENEARALQLMHAHGLPVPRLIAVDRVDRLCVLEWIEGRPVTAVLNSDVDAAISFLRRVHELRTLAGFGSSHHATEACLSVGELIRQVTARYERLAARAHEEPDLCRFIEDQVLPDLDWRRQQVQTAMDRIGQDFATRLPDRDLTLSPSDFGFHNALRRPDGSLAFVDFEYFGWDDPVKLVSDTLLHPGMPMTPAQRAYFRTAAERVYASQACFAARLRCLVPLYRLRWTLILLNEFLPEVWQRRVGAGATEDWLSAKRRQLERARSFLVTPAWLEEHANA
jgi:hypothetical protein